MADLKEQVAMLRSLAVLVDGARNKVFPFISQRIPAGSVFFSASSLLKNLAGWCTDSGAYESMVFAAMCLQVLWQPFAV